MLGSLWYCPGARARALRASRQPAGDDTVDIPYIEMKHTLTCNLLYSALRLQCAAACRHLRERLDAAVLRQLRVSRPLPAALILAEGRHVSRELQTVSGAANRSGPRGR
jgi:hypothetical protein